LGLGNFNADPVVVNICGYFLEVVNKDITWALQHYIAAASQSEENAKVNMGRLYMKGIGVKKDLVSACEWFKQCPHHIIGITYLALCYLKMGKLDEAIKYLTEASDYGYFVALNELGRRYLKGNGVRKDENEAFQLFKKAADQHYALAEYNLGCIYMKGFPHTKPDEKIASDYYKRAAEQGNKEAQYSLAIFFLNKRSTKGNEEAFKYLEVAANQNHIDAMYYLAESYYNGKGVRKDIPTAFTWYVKAAERRNPNAMFKLGFCELKGRGMPKNELSGMTLIHRAADAGNVEAKNFLKSIK